MKIHEKFDNRMQWVLMLEEYNKNRSKKEYFTEYEVCSDVRIPGVLNYGNGYLHCGIFQEKNEEGLYTYIIRTKHIGKEYKWDIDNYSKDGYYFKDGLIGELLAMFSVYFQIRFYLKSTITGELSPDGMRFRLQHKFQYNKLSPFLNYEMFSDQKRNWAHDDGLKLFLDKIRKLDQKYHQDIIQSFYWYTEAVKEIGGDHQLFFIKMVSAVESLLGFVEITKDDLEEKMKQVTKDREIFNEKDVIEIENWIRNRKIKSRFLHFFQRYASGYFKGGKRKAQHCFIKKEDLDKYIKRIYDARSKYLHRGTPMYLSFDMSVENCELWDLDPTLGMMIDRKTVLANDKLPRLRWFERITNHCIKKFIEEKCF